jgi:rhodanese-related sulfurtransferase
MNKIPLVFLQACLAVWLTGSFSSTAKASGREEPQAVTFFDVSDLPARVDAPRVSQTDKEFVLNCAVANRSNEDLLGLRLILLIVDTSGKLRGHASWTERTELAMYSIKTFAFHPEIATDLRNTDQIFLGIEEVFGRETIWHVAAAEKALRAYSRGQHDVLPPVRTFANKFDPRTSALVPIIRR